MIVVHWSYDMEWVRNVWSFPTRATAATFFDRYVKLRRYWPKHAHHIVTMEMHGGGVQQRFRRYAPRHWMCYSCGVKRRPPSLDWPDWCVCCNTRWHMFEHLRLLVTRAAIGTPNVRAARISDTYVYCMRNMRCMMNDDELICIMHAAVVRSQHILRVQLPAAVSLGRGRARRLKRVCKQFIRLFDRESKKRVCAALQGRLVMDIHELVRDFAFGPLKSRLG